MSFSFFLHVQFLFDFLSSDNYVDHQTWIDRNGWMNMKLVKTYP